MLFLDGTWDTYGDNTNVWRLKSLCASRADSGIEQLVYYSVGVGTSLGEEIRGGVLGYGVDKIVRDAYQWLIENYEQGDKLFLFGFSRGAFEARSLAGLISRFGILKRGAPLAIPQLFSRHKMGLSVNFLQTINQKWASESERMPLEDRWLHKYSQEVRIHFIGVWDTVGALGLPIPDNVPGISESTYKFYDTNLRLNYDNAVHALAIDEQRKHFAPTLWTKAQDNPAPERALDSVEQRWFVGTHGNVGGGYPSDSLPQVSLKWIMSRAEKLGLKLRDTVEVDDDYLSASIPDSRLEFLHGAYALFSPPYHRPIAVDPYATESGQVHTINETIDKSVFDRWNKVPSYKPPNLQDWAERYGIDLGQQNKSVVAHQPSTAAD